MARVHFEARNAYFAHLPVDGGIWNAPVFPMIREALLRFESETEPGARLACHIGVVSRSLRSFVMEEVVADVSDPAARRVVSTCRSVHVCVDPARGGSATVPDELVRAIEAIQGAPVPPTPVTGG